jgi:ubiquinone/menaquinone biosynthesis C-methylase UbiE
MPDHSEIYRSQAERYEALVSREDYQQNIFPALQQIVPFENLTVVEFGAGTGRLTCQLAPVVKFIHAFDISQHMLDVAAAKLKQSSLQNWYTAESDHRHIPIEEGIADVVISGWSVCYVVVDNPETWEEELSKVLSEMRRVVRPDGMIILLETLGTGCEYPQPPDNLIPYYEYLERHGFQCTWIRTDYRFESLEEAETLTCFFFGEDMLEKIRVNDQGVMLPECTGIWRLRLKA